MYRADRGIKRQGVAAYALSAIVEYMDWAPADLFLDLPACEDGQFRIPDRPGHGIALAPGAVQRYRLR